MPGEPLIINMALLMAMLIFLWLMCILVKDLLCFFCSVKDGDSERADLFFKAEARQQRQPLIKNVAMMVLGLALVTALLMSCSQRGRSSTDW